MPMTLREAIKDFILNLKCVKDALQAKEEQSQAIMKVCTERAKTEGHDEGYNVAYKEMHPTVTITLKYDKTEKIRGTVYKALATEEVEFEDENMKSAIKRGDVLVNRRVSDAIETLVRKVCMEEQRRAEDRIYVRRIIKVDSPLELQYMQMLLKLVDKSQFCEHMTNEYSEAIDEAKELLGLKFKGNVLFQTTAIAPIEGETVFP